MSKSSVDERLMKARITLCLTAPYLAGALMQLPISEAPSFISTFATDGFRIYYNRTYAASLTDSEIRGVLCHELLHVLTESRARRNGRNPRLWNVACDYAINAMLLAMGFHLPAGALYKNEFFLLAAEEIYELLKKEREALCRAFRCPLSHPAISELFLNRSETMSSPTAAPFPPACPPTTKRGPWMKKADAFFLSHSKKPSLKMLAKPGFSRARFLRKSPCPTSLWSTGELFCNTGLLTDSNRIGASFLPRKKTSGRVFCSRVSEHRHRLASFLPLIPRDR